MNVRTAVPFHIFNKPVVLLNQIYGVVGYDVGSTAKTLLNTGDGIVPPEDKVALTFAKFQGNSRKQALRKESQSFLALFIDFVSSESVSDGVNPSSISALLMTSNFFSSDVGIPLPLKVGRESAEFSPALIPRRCYNGPLDYSTT